MSPVGVLAIVVAVGEAKTPVTEGLLAAAEEALLAGTSVRISEVTIPTDDEALRLENELEARAAVSLSWEDGAHLHAHIRLHVGRTDRWTDRQIRFSSVDTPRERGRTIGFAIASMWPDGAAPVRNRPPPPAATGSTASSPGANGKTPNGQPSSGRSGPSTASDRSNGKTKPAEAAETAVRDTSRIEAAKRLAQIEIDREAAQARKEKQTDNGKSDADRVPREDVRAAAEPIGSALPRHAFGLALLGVEGVGGPAGGIGGAVDGALFLTRELAAHVGLSARIGMVKRQPLAFTDIVASIAAGGEWWFVPPSTRRTMGYGVRIDAVLLRHQVSANVPIGTDDNHGAWVPAVAAGPEASIRLSEDLEIVPGIGAEVALGEVSIRTGDPLKPVATMPMLRIAGQLGVRLRF